MFTSEWGSVGNRGGDCRSYGLFFFLSLSFFVNSHALGYTFSVLLVSCAFHFSFCIRLESCVTSLSVMTAEIPASQNLWGTYTSHALHSPPSYKEVCATRMLREKCTGCQDLRLASNRAQLYTCVYIYFFCPLDVSPWRLYVRDPLACSGFPLYPVRVRSLLLLVFTDYPAAVKHQRRSGRGTSGGRVAAAFRLGANHSLMRCPCRSARRSKKPQLS